MRLASMQKEGAKTLPKKAGWLALALLVFYDAFLTYLKGGEANPLWKPIVGQLGINALWLLAVLVLGLFYAVVKIAGKYAGKGGQKNGEEIVLTSLVIAFAAYDAWLVFFLPQFGYLGAKTHYAIIPVIAVPVLAYNLWLQFRKNQAVCKQIKPNKE
ncbi:hypothetical protein HY993_02320 [Candidatus Micrarchaeota archaeon]|nr:hypothetical protein [Candidatus Micrarchaeota archaeon]